METPHCTRQYKPYCGAPSQVWCERQRPERKITLKLEGGLGIEVPHNVTRDVSHSSARHASLSCPNLCLVRVSFASPPFIHLPLPPSPSDRHFSLNAQDSPLVTPKPYADHSTRWPTRKHASPCVGHSSIWLARRSQPLAGRAHLGDFIAGLERPFTVSGCFRTFLLNSVLLFDVCSSFYVFPFHLGPRHRVSPDLSSPLLSSRSKSCTL